MSSAISIFIRLCLEGEMLKRDSEIMIWRRATKP